MIRPDDLDLIERRAREGFARPADTLRLIRELHRLWLAGRAAPEGERLTVPEDLLRAQEAYFESPY